MPDSNSTYIIKVNDFEFSFTTEDADAADIIEISPGSFNLLKDNRSVNVQILETDLLIKQLVAELDGETFNISIKDELDQMIDKMGFNSVSKKQIKEIKAPMPGLVLEIAVTEGQELAEGDKVLILEAMKMENSIMIQTKAKIKKILVKTGQAVDKGQVMIELE